MANFKNCQTNSVGLSFRKLCRKTNLGLETKKPYNFDRNPKRNALPEKEQPKTTVNLFLTSPYNIDKIYSINSCDIFLNQNSGHFKACFLKPVFPN